MAIVRAKPFVWLALILALVTAAYAVQGLLLTASLSGAPNYPLSLAKLNERRWGGITLVSLLVAATSAVYLVRTRSRASTK